MKKVLSFFAICCLGFVTGCGNDNSAFNNKEMTNVSTENVTSNKEETNKSIESEVNGESTYELYSENEADFSDID